MFFKNSSVIFFIFFNICSKNKIVDLKLLSNDFCDELDIYFLEDPKFVREPIVKEEDLSKKKLLFFNTEISKNLINKITQIKNNFFSINVNPITKNNSLIFEIKFNEKKVLIQTIQNVNRDGSIYLKFRFCVRENLEKNIKNCSSRLRA